MKRGGKVVTVQQAPRPLAAAVAGALRGAVPPVLEKRSLVKRGRPIASAYVTKRQQ